MEGFYNTCNPSVICNLIVAYRAKLSIFIVMTPWLWVSGSRFSSHEALTVRGGLSATSADFKLSKVFSIPTRFTKNWFLRRASSYFQLCWVIFNLVFPGSLARFWTAGIFHRSVGFPYQHEGQHRRLRKHTHTQLTNSVCLLPIWIWTLNPESLMLVTACCEAIVIGSSYYSVL
jgi:hypothetical protein